jgi:hypothetical protein
LQMSQNENFESLTEVFDIGGLSGDSANIDWCCLERGLFHSWKNWKRPIYQLVVEISPKFQWSHCSSDFGGILVKFLVFGHVKFPPFHLFFPYWVLFHSWKNWKSSISQHLIELSTKFQRFRGSCDFFG